MQDENNRHSFAGAGRHKNSKLDGVVLRVRADDGTWKLRKVFGAVLRLIGLVPGLKSDRRRIFCDARNLRKWDVLSMRKANTSRQHDADAGSEL